MAENGLASLRNVAYPYDNDYRLASETVSGDPSQNGAISYTYDPGGNQTQRNSTVPAIPATGTLTYDANDRTSTDPYDANAASRIRGQKMEPSSSSDRELLERVIKRRDFLESILCNDFLDDWGLARDLGEFLVRIEPESDIMGHALLTRACRHLGDLVRAREELKQCRERTASRELKPWEVELFLPILAYEEKLLSPSDT